jgi:hypothetical protein
MEKKSRYIPANIRREVRKRCGFGCVICGNPFYQYDHMKEWAIVKEHQAEDITLLCTEHHAKIASGLLSRETVISANKSPFNLNKEMSSTLGLDYVGEKCSVIFGGNIYSINKEDFEESTAPILIDLIPVIEIKFEENRPLISIRMYDKSNNLILHVEENELSYSVNQWDVEWTQNILIIREELGKIRLKIKFIPPKMIKILSGRFYLNGIGVDINPNRMLILNSQNEIKGADFGRARVGIVIGKRSQYVRGAGIGFGEVGRFDVDNLIEE